ncbi:MAG: cyclopropane-fatty-acyl-phospholipid synthase [Verrucomicrobia bacterium]|nr:MAG: cyclopropane-fatty-acyl-phospholipid synthase [Verrucomicrobiota bacterium]
MSTCCFNRGSCRAKNEVISLFANADVIVNGKRPWDPQVHDDRFYARLLADGTLGFGESYTEGWWDCEALDELCFRVLRARLSERVGFNKHVLIATVTSICLNLQNKRGARLVGKTHYDLGNDFFEAMLDPAMQYSCAYFLKSSGLSDAQKAKMDLICRKLGLKPGMRLLDIGCGWGGLARYAAQYHGCEVVGITISSQQQQYAQKWCQGLPIEIRLQDYRDISEKFDRAVSVGMMEHVGHKNYRCYLDAVNRCLHENGLFLCHTICSNRSSMSPNPWLTRYIFPNSMLPSVSQITKAAEGLFVLEDAHNFGSSYDQTLLAWEGNFRKSWARFQGSYGERFYRMWRYYLLSCAGAFRARHVQLLQFVFSKHGVVGGYASIR